MYYYNILTDKRNATTKIKVFFFFFFFSQAVISSNYVGTNETKITRSIMFWRNLKLYAAVPWNLHKPWPTFDIMDAMFEFEFSEDLDTLKDKEGTR